MLKTAFRFLLYDKPKSIGALVGIIISVFLIGQQSGIFIFLINGMSALVTNNSEYVWVVDNVTNNANTLTQLDTRIGNEIESIDGVDHAYPIIVTAGAAKFENGKSTGVTLIGVETPSFAGGPWNMAIGKKEDLLKDGAIITDFFDKESLGGIELGQYFEINGKKVFNAANTKGIRPFGGMYTFTTIERARLLANIPSNKASAFLVKLKNKEAEKQIISLINSRIPGVRAWNSHEFAKATVFHVLAVSGIALSFGTLILFALVIGFVIIGLTLYSATIDRIKDYGTLKAIGATNGFIRSLIINQAMLIAQIGFTIGMFLVDGFKSGMAQSGTYFNFPVWLRLAFFASTMLMAFLGSLFAIHRIIKLEPAQVFRG